MTNDANLGAVPRSMRAVFCGIFLITMSTLVLQITLTRVFSSVLWYHFAFLAVSLALFGSGAAGQWIYLSQRRYAEIPVLERLQRAALIFSTSIPISFLAFTHQRGLTGWLASFGLEEMGLWTLTYVVFAVPFFFAGSCVALALSAFRSEVSRLYFFDLFGAGLGCLAVVPLLSWLGGPGTVQAVSALAALGSMGFAFETNARRRVFSGVVLAGMLLLIPAFASIDIPVLIEGKATTLPKVAERWNAFSRVAVHQKSTGQPMLWGLGSNVKVLPSVGNRTISIDGYAGTPMIEWDGDLSKIDYLAKDISAIAYFLVDPGISAVVIGSGGGRDVLTALLFGVDRIHAVEINPLVVDYTRNEFGEFTGHIYDHPKVTVVVDEGRSYIAKLDERVDLIQASMVDTAAASLAGAFSLTENNLYTVEAFEQYYEHLTDDGFVTVTRAFPSEALRLLGIAMDAWRRKGVENPAEHIVVVNSGGSHFFPLANVIVKRSPFTAEEIAELDRRAEEIGFGVAYKPGGGEDERFLQFASAQDLDEFAKAFPIDISPTRDDSPFFFNFVRIRDVLFSDGAYIALSVADNATIMLMRILGIVTALTLLFILGPLVLRERLPVGARQTGPYLFYFTCLGFAFILIELPLIHRFVLFLGHPVYALTVVLFALLIFSGLGSLSTQRVPRGSEQQALERSFVWLLAVLVPSILLVPPILRAFVGAPTFGKAIAAVVLIAPMGFVMGRPFPLGLRVVHGRVGALVPWVWGVNGAASVMASVVATVLAMTYGFTVAMAVGLACYASAWATSRAFRSQTN